MSHSNETKREEKKRRAQVNVKHSIINILLGRLHAKTKKMVCWRHTRKGRDWEQQEQKKKKTRTWLAELLMR